jgi:hypothetical protein
MDSSAIAVSVELAPVYVIKEYGIDLARLASRDGSAAGDGIDVLEKEGLQ